MRSKPLLILCVFTIVCCKQKQVESEPLYAKFDSLRINNQHFKYDTIKTVREERFNKSIDSLSKIYKTPLNLKKQYKYYFSTQIKPELFNELDVATFEDFQYIYKNFKPEYCTTELEAGFYFELAHLYGSVGLTNDAITHLEKAMDLYPNLSNFENDYRLLGTYYYQIGEYDKAIESYKQTLEFYSNLRQPIEFNIGGTNNNIGFCFMKKEEIDSAFHYFSKAIYHINRHEFEEPEEKGLAIRLLEGNKGDAYMVKNNYKEAIPYFEKEVFAPLPTSKKLQEEYCRTLFKSSLSLTECYFETNRLEEASKIINGLELSGVKDLELKKKYYSLLKKIALTKNDVERLKDIEGKIEEVNIQQTEDQKRKEESRKVLQFQIQQEKLNSENIIENGKKTRMLIVVGFALVLIILLVVLIRFYLRYKKEKNQTEFYRKEVLRLVDHNQTTEPDETIEFTKREKEIIPLIIQGKTNKEIGEILFISTNTVKYHIKKLYIRLNVSSREEVVNKFSKEN